MTQALRIVVASNRQAALEHFTRALAMETGAAVHRVQEVGQVLDLVREAAPTMVVIDAQDPVREPKALITDILMANAMIHTAVLTPLPEDEFHEAFEGLGVLVGLPTAPNGSDARRLARLLAGVMPQP